MNLKHKHITHLKFVVGLLLTTSVFVSCGTKKKEKSKEQTIIETPNPDKGKGSPETIYKNNFYEALRLKTVGDLEESQKVLEWCLKQKPNDDAVLYLLATYAENDRRITKASDYIKRAIEVDPNNIWYIEMQAKLLINSDDFVGAEKNFERLVAYDRYNREWLYYYSETLIFNRKYAEAIDIISRLIDEIGPVPDFVHQRNELYLELKRDEEMLQSLRKIILEYPDMPEFPSMLMGYYRSKKILDQGEKELLDILKTNQNHGAARIALADLYNMQGKQSKSLDQLKLAFESNTLDADKSIQVLLSVLERQAEVDPKAMELALILQEKYPTNFMTHLLVGEIHKQQGKRKEALIAYEKSLELNQDNFELWLEVITMNYSMKRYNDAQRVAEQALELFPSQPQFYYYAGMSAVHNKSFSEALEHLELGKDNVVRDNALKAQFELAFAEAYFAQNNIPKARKHMESADYLAPNDKLLKNNRAYLLAKYKVDLDKALTLIDQAMSDNQNDALFLDTKAWVHFARKEYSDALTAIQKAHGFAPNNGDINEHYGDILYTLGKTDEALSYWIKAKELGDASEALLKKIQTKKMAE